MAVYSMTGYASATASPVRHTAQDSDRVHAPAVTVELRSVNGRFLDLALRLPDELRSLEPALRELVGAQVRRGKVELRVVTQRDAESALCRSQRPNSSTGWRVSKPPCRRGCRSARASVACTRSCNGVDGGAGR